MKANSFTCTDSRAQGTTLELDLSGVTAEEAIAADWSTIRVATDDGDVVEAYAGYAPLYAVTNAQTKAVTLRLFADPDGVSASLSALAKDSEDNKATAGELSDALADLGSTVSTNAESASTTDDAIVELGELVSALDERVTALEQAAGTTETKE